MKLIRGIYKVPEMFPKSFSFPGGYKLHNTTESIVYVSLLKAHGKETCYHNVMNAGESLCVYLEKDNCLEVGGTVEMEPYDPEKDNQNPV